MRWLSLFVVLIYLNLLCAPQAFAVHDMRISSLADKQLQALTPSIQPHTLTVSQDSDNDSPALLADNLFVLFANAIIQAPSCNAGFVGAVNYSLPEARAPPVFLTAI